jgi:hypothetical protein
MRGKLHLSILTWIIACINACIGILIFNAPDLYREYGLFFFLVSLLNVLLLMIYFRHAFLFQLRLIFLSAVGIFAGIVKLINPDLVFSPVGLQVQTFQIGVMMFGLTSVALLGAAIGFNMIRSPIPSYCEPPLFKNWSSKIIFYISVPFIIWIGILSAASYGPPIWDGVYASDGAEGQLLGNLQSMGIIFLTLAFISAKRLKENRYRLLSLFLIGYLLIWGILIRGGRLEFLSGLLTIFIATQVSEGKSPVISFKKYLYLAGAAVLMEVFGYLRATLASTPAETMFEMYQRFYESGLIFAGTLSGIASTFANVLHMIRYEVVDFQYGLPYLEYILRSPPQFLYPDRPRDLSSIFEIYSYASMGGFFELAEAYLNFGVVGVFLVPFFLSWLIAYIYKQSIRGHNFSFFLLLGLISVFPRGAWYQSFAYYKSLLTGALIFLIYLAAISTYRVIMRSSTEAQ